MKKFEIEFSDENGSEIFEVNVSMGRVLMNNVAHIADFKKNSSDGLRSFYSVRLRGEVLDLPTKCYNFRTVAETALTAYL